jgi:hypothetical protein
MRLRVSDLNAIPVLLEALLLIVLLHHRRFFEDAAQLIPWLTVDYIGSLKTRCAGALSPFI